MSPAEKRKVMQVGGSNLIALPKWWCRKREVSPGDYVNITERDDGALVVKLAEKDDAMSSSANQGGG